MINETTFVDKLEWIKKRNPLTMRAIDRYRANDYTGVRLGYVAHIEPKMISHMEFFIKNGAELHIAPGVPGVKDLETYEYLQSIGARTYGVNANNWNELRVAWSDILKQKPNYIFEMGGGLITEAVAKNIPIIAAGEATGSGINKIENLNLTFPVFDWNNVPLKRLMHNRYEVGSGIWFAFRNLTGLDLCRMNVLVVGFGLVGQSVASIARGLGARVFVYDIDKVKTLAAASEGYFTGEFESLIKDADVVVTATGKPNVIGLPELQKAKSEVIILNAGHDNREINLEGATLKKAILPKVALYSYKNKEIYLLADGLLLNLAGGGGSAINTFDLCTALMVELINHMLTKGKEYPKGLRATPDYLMANILM